MDLLDMDRSDILSEELEQEEAELVSLDVGLTTLMEVAHAIEQEGATQASVVMLNSAGLLSSSSYAALAIESLNFTVGPEQQTKLAVESLMDTIKEKAAAWGAKILKVGKEVTAKIMALISPLVSAVGDLVKKLSSKAWDGVKAAGQTIKAHPFATLITVVSAIGAVGGLMAYCGSSLPGGSTTRDALATFFGKVNEKINHIPWPGSKITSTVSKAGDFKIDNVFEGAGSASANKMGWTATSVKVLGAKLDAAVAEVRKGAQTLGMKLLSITGKVGHRVFVKAAEFKRKAPHMVYDLTGSSEMAHATSFAVGGIYFGLCLKLVFMAYRLVKRVVVGGLRLIGSTLRGLVGGGFVTNKDEVYA